MFLEEFCIKIYSLLKKDTCVEIHFKGLLVLVQTHSEDNSITLTTVIYSQENRLHSGFLPFINYANKERLLQCFSFLEKDLQSIKLVQKIPFVFPRQSIFVIKNFILLAKKWALILKNLSEEHFLVS